MTRVVVGVDGSQHSEQALRRAIEEADLRDGTVEAVYVYSPPRRGFSDDLVEMPFGATAPAGAIASEDRTQHELSRGEEAAAQATRELERFVANSIRDTSGPTPELVVVGASNAAEVLIMQSGRADLLVIGTRGRGGFAGALLGSVAHQCIQHGKCPILVIPPEAE